MKKILKGTLFTILSIIGVVFLVVVGYLSYVLIQYHRIEDDVYLNIEERSELDLQGNQFKISTYNIGFGAYRQDFSFFMDEGYMQDGTKVVGKSSRAVSKESVIEATEGAINEIKSLDADFVLYQEVDTNSDRSHHVNQYDMVKSEFNEFDSVFASNYHSAYLFYPFTKPIGKSNSGLVTLSKYKIEEAKRRSYPLSNGFDKFFDLDRCFMVNRLKVNETQDLVIVNSHMSAYDKGGKIRAKQMETLKVFFQEEVDKNNYVVIGGDFNHDLLKYNPNFAYENESDRPGWMNFTQLKPDWLASVDYENDILPSMKVGTSDNAPTCRDADIPYLGYENDVYKSVIDGFIVSQNIEIISVTNIDNAFLYSDHQPVEMVFRLL